MAERVSLITLYTGPAHDALIIEHDEARGILISAQTGEAEVRLCIPPAKWFPMARQIYESRATLSLFDLANDR